MKSRKRTRKNHTPAQKQKSSTVYMEMYRVLLFLECHIR